jgi:secondary thiamine-phosphate synthase enzyme
MEELQVKTHNRVEMIDITRQIQALVHKSGVINGACVIFVPHTTAAVTINENADPAVIRDMLAELNKIVPLQNGYSHSEGNSAAHIKSSLTGCSQTVIIEKGTLQLGTWQSLFFCEFDGPRNRTVWIKILKGE